MCGAGGAVRTKVRVGVKAERWAPGQLRGQVGGERGPWAACGPGLEGRNGPPSPSHEAAATHPSGALGSCRLLPGCAGDSPHLRAWASTHAGAHTHACTHVHVHARNTRMHAPSLRELSGGHVSTPGDPARLGQRVPLPPHCLSHTCHGGEGVLVPQWPPAPKHPHCPAGQSHTGSSAGAAPALGTSGHWPGCPAFSCRAQAAGWGLAASLSALNQPLGHGPGPHAEHMGPDAASTWSRASLAQQHGGEAGHAPPPGTLCPAPPSPAA